MVLAQNGNSYTLLQVLVESYITVIMKEVKI
jgi:hypothetical protein